MKHVLRNEGLTGSAAGLRGLLVAGACLGLSCGAHVEEKAPPADSTVVTMETVDVVPERPIVVGDWWRIAHNPELGIYNDRRAQPVDFSIWQAADGTWQMVACVRYTTYPGESRLLFRWEAQSLTDQDWDEKGIFLSSADAPEYRPGQLQAPHVIRDQGRYYMFYNSAGHAFVRVSDDGKNFTRHIPSGKPDGDPRLFEMGRDVMVFDNRERDGKLHAYYTWIVPPKYPDRRNHTMGVRSAPAIAGPWSEPLDLGVRTPGTPDSPFNFINAESPFVLHRKGLYYLWEQMKVFVSQDPLHFQGPEVTTMSDGDPRAHYAPEIIEHDGQYFIAGYKYNEAHDGLYMARFDWK